MGGGDSPTAAAPGSGALAVRAATCARATAEASAGLPTAHSCTAGTAAAASANARPPVLVAWADATADKTSSQNLTPCYRTYGGLRGRDCRKISSQKLTPRYRTYAAGHLQWKACLTKHLSRAILAADSKPIL